MPNDSQHNPLRNRPDRSGSSTYTVAAAQRVAKRPRIASLATTATPSTNEHSSSDVDMDVPAAAGGRGDGTNSDASSDWDDWADAMVAQGEPPEDSTTPATGDDNTGHTLEPNAQAQEEAWVRSMIEQGTLGSVVQAADSRAWDYVLQMAVEEEGRESQQGSGEWVRGNGECCVADALRSWCGCGGLIAPQFFG